MHLRSSSPASGSSSRASTFRWKLRLGAAAAILASSCSLVYDLSPDQCGNDSECARFGEGFLCQEGICVDHSPSVGGSTAGRGSGGSGNDTGTGGTSNEAGAGGDAGSESGGSTSFGGSPDAGGTAGTAGTAGTGGTDPVDCETHNECFAKYGDAEPWACVENVCQPLKTEECPVVLPFDDGDYRALRDTDAIIIGAFSRIDVGEQNAQTENFDLALRQISSEVGGIPANNKHREVVAVVCGSVYENRTDLLTPVDHLIGDLKVPGILATLSTADQQYVFEQRTYDAGVFMMVPNSSDDDIVNLPDDGLVYHMLAGPSSLAQTYQPLIDMTITELQNKGKLGTSPDYEEARIALVTNVDDRFLADLGADFEYLVKWNGRSASDNADVVPSRFFSIATHFENGSNQEQVAADIVAFAPHIIVSASYAEMTNTIMPLVEAQWAEDAGRVAQGKPSYVLSPFNYGFPTQALLAGKPPELRQRIVGIGWPATLQSDAYKAYKTSYQRIYAEGKNYDVENFYDATYFLVYGMVSAGPQIRGATIAAGMARITDERGVPYNVGTRDLADAFSHLATNVNSKIDLTGANGRPQWNAGGGRSTPASVWCIDSALEFVPDALTYDKESAMLTGSLSTSCFTSTTP